MGKWRKRTEAEIDASVRLGDYTGGYGIVTGKQN